MRIAEQSAEIARLRGAFLRCFSESDAAEVLTLSLEGSVTPQPAKIVQEADVVHRGMPMCPHVPVALARISTRRCTVQRTRRSKRNNCLKNRVMVSRSIFVELNMYSCLVWGTKSFRAKGLCTSWRNLRPCMSMLCLRVSRSLAFANYMDPRTLEYVGVPCVRLEDSKRCLHWWSLLHLQHALEPLA